MTTLVTGGMGCIGAWTIHHLLEQGEQVICFDQSTDRHRLDLLMSRDRQAAVTFVAGDITDAAQVAAAASRGVTHIIHLAALQVPQCRANPALGAQVNVTGTIHVFEAARAAGIKHLAYASSIAVYGTANEYPPGLLAHDAPLLPKTLYGVYKVANEGTARMYWQDYGISSTALRPYTVFGLGRDQGLTSEPTKAMQAAARGEDYQISFGGRMQFHFASDVARQFIEASRSPLAGAFCFNLGTPPIPVAEVAQVIMQVRPDVIIRADDRVLPFAEGCDPSALYAAFSNIYETPLVDAVRATIDGFTDR